MADSTEDLKQEMEQFERQETSGPDASASTAEAGTSTGTLGRTVPTWVYWMIVADVVIIAAVVLILMA
jgi:hypothetical protein